MGVRPWEIPLLTVRQLDEACADIDTHLHTEAQRAALAAL